MALKAKITATEHAALPAELKSHYKLNADFSYSIDLGDTGFITDKDPAGLLSALEKEREENKRVKAVADKLEKERLEAERKSITDVEELKKHFEAQFEAEKKRQADERKKMEAERLEGQQRAAEQFRKTKALEVASELFGTNAALMLPHVEMMLKPVPGDAPGVEIVDRTTGKPSIDQSFEGFKKVLSTNPVFAPMIVVSKASGGSANDGSKSKGASTVRDDGKPKTYADYKPSELMALKRENPELFKSLKSQG